MAQKINAEFQIKAGSIVDANISASAAIALSKLAEAVIQADGGQAFTNDQSMGSNRLTALSPATQGTDAINLNQLESAVNKLSDLGTARMATTQDLTAESFGTSGVTYDNGASGVGATLTQDVPTDGAFTGVDSVTTPLVGQKVLVHLQTNSFEGGPFVITVLGNGTDTSWVLTRADNADTISTLKDGAVCNVTEGTVWGEQTLRQTDVISAIGSGTQTWTQTSGAGQITAGTGMTRTGNTLNVISANAGILANADNMELQVDATAATIAVGGAGIQIADGTAGYMLIGKGAAVDTAFTEITGDVTISSGGVTAIASGAIVNDDVNSSAAIALSKLASGTDTYVVVCNGSGVPTYVAMSGDATIANTGAVSLASTVLKEADVVTAETPSGTINGTDGTDGNAAFTLAATPVTGSERVFVNGVRQTAGASDSYEISTNTITFKSGWIPVTGDTLRVDYFK